MAVRGQVPRLSQLTAQVPAPPQNRTENARSASTRWRNGHKAALHDAKAGGVAESKDDLVLGLSGVNWGEGDDIITGDWAGIREALDERERMADLGIRSLGAMDFEGRKMGGYEDATLEEASVLELLSWEGGPEDLEVEERATGCVWGGGARGKQAQDGRLAELRSLTIKGLRTLCRQHGLILKGTKEELVSRISAYEQRTGQASIRKPGSTAADLFNCLSWELPAEVAL